MGTLDDRGHFPLAILGTDGVYLRRIGGAPNQDGYATLDEVKPTITADSLPKAGGTMTGNLVVDGVTEKVDSSPITVSANPEVLDITHKTILQRRLRTGVAEVFSLPDPTTHNGKSFSVFLHQVATGNPVATSVTFTGADPGDAGTFVVSNLNDKVDLVNFVCLNNKWYMSAIKGYGI